MRTTIRWSPLLPLFQLILVAVIQGLTEFLPVSSSGHLILLPNLTGMEDQGQFIDVAVHVGTLGAVILYFRADVARALSGVPRLLQAKVDTPESRLAFYLIVATIPVLIAGLILKVTGLSEAMRGIAVIGWTMLLFGLLLYWADQRAPGTKTAEDWSYRDAWILGFWQAVALIPGTSRSGICITGARALGYDRTEAARLAMLMSIPTILASGILLGAETLADANTAALRDGAIAAAMAFVAALVALWGMMRLLEHVSYTPYVVYRVALGLILLWIAYT